jgi:creatinine amidohydrolase/Fe(II)-dependent formamide hydrolase-like protein
MTLRKRALLILLFVTAAPVILLAQAEEKPLVLQEMSWVDVQEYLKSSDMVIIPLGSTEQHGPHLPLGTDFFEAFEISKKISAKTGVLVAPILLAGYSEYHSGFPGTLSVKPETMQQVVFECVEMLQKYGFRRFMFFNYHGGNNVAQAGLIYRINQETEGIAVALGVGSSLPSEESEDSEFFDWHAGLGETSIMLYLKPELVRTDSIEKPVITFSPKMKTLLELAEKNPELMIVFSSLTGTPAAAGKGGASHELSSNGIWSFSDVKAASAEIGRAEVEETVEAAVRFINAWKDAEQ